MKRFATIDFIRGLSIFMMIFLHLLDDLYDKTWIDTMLNSAPLFNVVLLLCAMYFGSWAGLFLMISATGNMVSMMNSYEKGKSVKSIVLKQVVGGFILLIFGFLAEGTLQYYGLFQTIRNNLGNPAAIDWTRILWKGFTMETIHTIAWCMIINGIIQGLLSINGGFRKVKRNIIIYAVIAIVAVAVTQPIWDWANSLFPVYASPGYPLLQTVFDSDRTVQGPLDLLNFGEYLVKFFLLPLAGHPEPIFPFLAVSCIGSIFGLLIIQEPNSRKWPKRGVLIGLLVVVAGLLIWIIADMPFNSLLPFSDFSIFRRIGDGLNYEWLPWICFITGGQIIALSLIFRLVEFRGKSKKFAEKTALIRRFGMVPFTMYTFHRTLSMIPLAVLSLIFAKDMLIDCKDIEGAAVLPVIAICILFLYGLLRLWEKKDYIGSLEWMIGTIGSVILKTPTKEGEERPKWYRRGARDQKALFYNVEWIDIFKEGDNGGDQYRNSKLAFKCALVGLIGLLMVPATMIGLGLVRSSVKLEGANKYNKRAKIVGIVAAIVNIVVIAVFYLISLDTLGISL